MQQKIILLTTLFALLFSLQTFSQTTEKSDHPLLDKYYPTPKKDTNTVIAPATKPVVETKPVVRPQASPIISTAPVAPSAVPVATSPNIPAATSPNIPVETQPVVVTSIAPAIKADTAAKAPETAVTNKIAPVTNPAPVKKAAAAQPVTQPYRSTRLGSSSKLYDTWEKNNNGAGSVTTGGK
jgi:hypothetical protein